MFTCTENIRGETTAPKPTANPIDMAMKNQSISSLEAGGGEGGNSEGRVWLSFVKGGPYNPLFPS